MGRTMAYRRSNGKGRRKLQPAAMQISLIVPDGESYVDLALCASILNRRGYKQQCTNWAVGSFEVFQAASPGGVLRIDKAPETWVAQNAYTKSKALWDQMNDQILEDEPGIQGKYHDFKIGLDANHVLSDFQDASNPTGRILTPVIVDINNVSQFTGADFNGAAGADWDFSKLTIPNDGGVTGVTADYMMHLVGPDAGASKGLIAGYELSRSRPNQVDPNVPRSEGWMTELFDDGQQMDDLRDNINDDNDRPPYRLGAETGSSAYYPGGANDLSGLQTHSFCNFTGTTVSGKNTIMGGVFNYGLMKLTNSTGEAMSLIIHLIPGDHRGYMVEMI